MDIPQSDKPVNVAIVSEVPTYATVFGVLALIAAILALLIPVLGTVVVTPVAILLGIIALWSGAKGFGIATFVILVVKLAISPVFWVNLWIGATEDDAAGNRILSYVIVLGILLMFVLLFKKRKR